MLAAQDTPSGGAPMTAAASWFDGGGRPDVLSGGVRTIPVETPRGTDGR